MFAITRILLQQCSLYNRGSNLKNNSFLLGNNHNLKIVALLKWKSLKIAFFRSSTENLNFHGSSFPFSSLSCSICKNTIRSKFQKEKRRSCLLRNYLNLFLLLLLPFSGCKNSREETLRWAKRQMYHYSQTWNSRSLPQESFGSFSSKYWSQLVCCNPGRIGTELFPRYSADCVITNNTDVLIKFHDSCKRWF